MSLRKNFKTNRDLEINGVDVVVDTNDHNGEPIKINISRLGTVNKKFTAMMEEETAPYQSSMANGTMDNDLAGQILRRVFVSTVLNGWTNLPKSELTGDDNDTELLEFTKDNALALFAAMPDVFDDWNARAKKVATFRDSVNKANAGN